jgi:hypothetical protein
VAAENACPLVTVFHEGDPMVPGPEDVEALRACTLALVKFFLKTGPGLFEDDEEAVEPQSMTFTGEDGVTVRVTYPFDPTLIGDDEFGDEDEAVDDFAPENWDDLPPMPVRAAPRVGRNDPCPCGSGKKYKKCCIDKPAAAVPAAVSPADDSPHAMDRVLVNRILAFAEEIEGTKFRDVYKDFTSPETTLPLVFPYAAYCYDLRNRGGAGRESLLARFLKAKGARLSARERSWLEAQQRAWLSVWEVEEIRPGERMTLIDRLTGERRVVLEESGLPNMTRRSRVLGRIATFEGASFLCGFHTRLLPPGHGENVVEKIRRELRMTDNVPCGALQTYAASRSLLRLWEKQVAAHDGDRRRPT